MINNNMYIFCNKENTVIRSLLLEFLEEETIDSFLSLTEYPTQDIGEFLNDCFSNKNNQIVFLVINAMSMIIFCVIISLHLWRNY